MRQDPKELLNLITKLRQSGQPLHRIRLLFKMWRAFEDIPDEERPLLLRELGLEKAEHFLRHFLGDDSRISPEMASAGLTLLRNVSPARLKSLARHHLSPEETQGLLDALEETLHEHIPTEEPAVAAAEQNAPAASHLDETLQPGAIQRDSQPIPLGGETKLIQTPGSQEPAPETSPLIQPPPGESAGIGPEKTVNSFDLPPVEAEAESPTTELGRFGAAELTAAESLASTVSAAPDFLPPVSVSPLVTPQPEPDLWARLSHSSDETDLEKPVSTTPAQSDLYRELAQLESATSRLLRIRGCSGALAQMTEHQRSELLHLFPPGWMRRRVLMTLFRAGGVRQFPEALRLLQEYGNRPVDYLWLAGALADSRQLSATEQKRLLELAPSETMRRLLGARLRDRLQPALP